MSSDSSAGALIRDTVTETNNEHNQVKLLVCHFSFLKQFDVICDLFNRNRTERGPSKGPKAPHLCAIENDNNKIKQKAIFKHAPSSNLAHSGVRL